MSFNSTLWRPDPETARQIRRGNETCRTATTSEAQAAARAKAERIKKAENDEADKWLEGK